MPGRVDDVQADVAVVDRRLLGEDRDALLALQVARVHDPVDDGLVGAEGAGLAQHGVDERGLAVVDVGDDGDVAQVVARDGCRTGMVGLGTVDAGHGACEVSHIGAVFGRRRPAASIRAEER